MVNDPQADDLLRLRLLRGYGLAYLNGTNGDGLYIQGGEYYTKDDFNGVPSTINWARDEGWEPSTSYNIDPDLEVCVVRVETN